MRGCDGDRREWKVVAMRERMGPESGVGDDGDRVVSVIDDSAEEQA
jgi:hypothetical protein